MMKKIKGIIPPMVTPLLDNETIDREGAARLVEHMIGGGVHALFLLGTTGESQSISLRLRYEFVEIVCKMVAGRVPVLVAVTETSLEEALRLARHAADCGAEGVVAAAPYYFAPSQNDMVNWFTALADASPLPVYLYNMPSHVKVFMEAHTVAKLAEHPNIAGLKDSSANMTYFRTLHHLLADKGFSLYVGPEELTAECMIMGADGGVNGGANMFPELYVQIYDAACALDMPKVLELQKRIMQISDTIYNVGGSYLRSLKCALNLLGLCSDYVALPYDRHDAEHRAQVRKALEALGVECKN